VTDKETWDKIDAITNRVVAKSSCDNSPPMPYDWKQVYVSTPVRPEDLKGDIGAFMQHLLERKIEIAKLAASSVLYLDEPFWADEENDEWREREDALVWGE